MKKTLVAILAGRGEYTARGKQSKYDQDRFVTFHDNKDQDVVAFTDTTKHPNWKPKHFTVQHNGQPYENTVSIVSRLRNTILDYAENNGYEKLWMIDDDGTAFYKYDDYSNEDLEAGKTPTFEKFPPLPEIEHPFGGILGSNFKRFKLATGKKYSNQMPVGCIYLDLKKLKNMGGVPRFEEQILLWDDYDFFLKLRKMGIAPMTHNYYAFIKPFTQDQKVQKSSTGTGAFRIKSQASSGMEKVINMGFNLYKRYGSENCICKKKLNIVDVHPAMTTKFHPIVFRHRIDTLSHWLEDILDDDNTKYVRASDKVKRGDEMEWLSLVQREGKKPFRFGQ